MNSAGEKESPAETFTRAKSFDDWEAIGLLAPIFWLSFGKALPQDVGKGLVQKTGEDDG